jgi:uncharacterized protein
MNPPLLSFPCIFPIKIIGKTDFEQVVMEILRRHVPDLDENSVHTRPSSNHKYLALTVTIVVRSQAELDALYQELSAHERVLMVL